MKKLMNIIVLSCRKATFLIEKGHNDPLSLFDKLQLSMHLKICEKCSAYQKQSLFIENLLKTHHTNLSNPSNFKLSDTSKIRIQKVLEGNLKNN